MSDAVSTYVVTFTGINGAGSISTPGTKVGDKVLMLYLASDSSCQIPALDTYEPIISVDDHIQQLATNNRTSNNWTAVIARTS